MSDIFGLLSTERWVLDPLATGLGWMLVTPYGYMARVRGTGPVQTSLSLRDTRTAYLAHCVYVRNVQHSIARIEALDEVPRATLSGCPDRMVEPIPELNPTPPEGISS